MATVAVTTSPVTLDSGSSEFVTVANTGTVDVAVVRGSQSFTLRPGQSRTVYPEGSAVTASVVSGSGQVSTSAQAARQSQAQQYAADPAFTGTYGPSTIGNRLRRAASGSDSIRSLVGVVMATPPTITYTTADPDATLTAAWKFSDTAARQANLRFVGGTPLTAFGNHYRFPVVTLPTGTGNVTATQSANGWAVEFMTDAPKIKVKIAVSASVPGLMAEVDGQPVASTSTAHPATSGFGYFYMDFTSAGGVKPRRVRIECDAATGWEGVYIAPIYSVWAPRSETKVIAACVGDSLYAQTNVTKPNGGWQHTVGKLLGWDNVYQIGLGGTGWIAGGSNASPFAHTQRIADTVAVNPDIILFPATSNDDGQTSGALSAAVTAGIQAYRAALPNAAFVFHGAWPGVTGPNATRQATETYTKAGFTAAADPNSWFIDLANDTSGSWITGTGHVGATTGTGNADIYINSADTTHPSQAGYDYMARRWANAFLNGVLPNIK